MTMFTATLDRKALIGALDLFKTPTCNIIQARMQHAVLKCVRLEARNDIVTVSGTDLDCTVAIELPADTQSNGAVILNFVALRDALKAMDGETVRIADTGGARARVNADSGQNMLPIHTAEDWPIESGLWHTTFETRPFDSKALVADLNSVIPAISTEETRYYLNGVFFRVEDATLHMAATDGHRLSVLSRGISHAFDENPDVIVPRNAINWIARNAAKLGESVSIGWTASQLVVKAGRVRFCTKLIDGTFPEYTRVIPTIGERQVAFDADATAKATKAATAHCDGKTRAVVMSVGADFHTMVGNDPENGRATALVSGSNYSEPADESGGYSVGFNASYLAEMLGIFKGERVIMSQADAAAPALFQSNDSPELKVVLMPMRVDGPVYSPEELAKADRDAIETFEGDAPEVIEAIKAMKERGIDTSERLAALGKLTSAAIDLYAKREGVERSEARAIFIAKLTEMRGVDDKQDEKSHLDAQEPVAPEPVADPLYRNLQAFKAQAGVGSRWRLENWSYDAGDWGEPRERTVATVKARELGFVDGDATPQEIAEADANGRAEGRSWWTFPKQGEWRSEADCLIKLDRHGEPAMRITPLPAHTAPVEAAPDQTALIERLKAENASLATQVAEARTAETEAQEEVAALSAELSEMRTTANRALYANTELKAKSSRRIRRLSAVLAGRKRQLTMVSRDLLAARTRQAGDLRANVAPVLEVKPIQAPPAAPIAAAPKDEPPLFEDVQSGDGTDYCAVA